ncbi:MAG: hypothetical protein BM563_08095 [Bacteroidetes bacterium MedPE-SWsnd-G1]|nr:MAG: hypothetical protein BM563_08095 [Bacteroidetes bacterium MedPE-SWsnd-G1]
MIKLFRKIRRQLILENKTSKYLKYAIGEIFLVVIGILIALQINNWNQQRNNNKKEQELLKNIHIEFVKNQLQLNKIITERKTLIKNCNKVIEMLPINELTRPTLDSLKLYLSKTFTRYTFNPSQGTVNSLVSTSSFNLIQSIELRNALISWSDLVVDYQEEENTSSNYYRIYDSFFQRNVDFDFNFEDSRNNLSAFQTLEFEYILKARKETIEVSINDDSELEELTEALNLIIELSKPNKL